MAVAFDPAGERIVAGSRHLSLNSEHGSAWTHSLRVWDAGTGNPIHTLMGTDPHVEDPPPVFCVAFSPDGRRIVSGGSEKRAEEGTRIPIRGSESGRIKVVRPWIRGAVKVWDAETGREIRTLTGPEVAVCGVAYGERIVCVDRHNVISSWDPEEGHAILATLKSEGTSNSAGMSAFSADALRVASIGVASTDSPRIIVSILRLWDLSRHQTRTLRTHLRPAYRIALSPDGDRIACVGSGSTIRFLDREDYDGMKLWDFESGSAIGQRKDRPIPIPELKGDYLTVLSFSSDGSQLVAGTQYGAILLWDAKAGRLIRSFDGPPVPVRAVAFRPQGLRVASGGHKFRDSKSEGARNENGVLKFEDLIIWDIELPSNP